MDIKYLNGSNLTTISTTIYGIALLYMLIAISCIIGTIIKDLV